MISGATWYDSEGPGSAVVRVELCNWSLETLWIIGLDWGDIFNCLQPPEANIYIHFIHTANSAPTNQDLDIAL